MCFKGTREIETQPTNVPMGLNIGVLYLYMVRGVTVGCVLCKKMGFGSFLLDFWSFLALFGSCSVIFEGVLKWPKMTKK